MKTAILFHGDADGICSAVMYALSRREDCAFFTPEWGSAEIDSKTIEEIRDFRPEKLVILDLSYSKEMETLYELAPTLHIDHHLTEFPNRKGVEYINPRKEGRNPVPCVSGILYELLGRTELAWIAAIGIISDKAVDATPEPVRLAEEKLGKETLRKLVLRINAARLGNREGVLAAVRVLIAAFNQNMPSLVFGGLPDADKLKRLETQGRKELARVLASIKPEKIGEYTVIRFKSPLPIQNLLVSRLRKAFDPIIVINEGMVGEYAYLEARGSKNIAEKLFKILKLTNGSFGGHENAVGARIPKNEVKAFLSLLS